MSLNLASQLSYGQTYTNFVCLLELLLLFLKHLFTVLLNVRPIKIQFFFELLLGLRDEWEMPF